MGASWTSHDARAEISRRSGGGSERSVGEDDGQRPRLKRRRAQQSKAVPSNVPRLRSREVIELSSDLEVEVCSPTVRSARFGISRSAAGAVPREQRPSEQVPVLVLSSDDEHSDGDDDDDVIVLGPPPERLREHLPPTGPSPPGPSGVDLRNQHPPAPSRARSPDTPRSERIPSLAPRSAPSTKGKERLVDDDYELDFSSEQSFAPFSKDLLEKLQDERFSYALDHLAIEQHEASSRPLVRPGDVVRVSQGEDESERGSDAPWLCQVQQIRVLDADPSVRAIRARWLYSIESFSSKDVDILRHRTRWSKTIHALGRKEYVSTDHEEWVRPERITRGPFPLLRFEDRYPAPTEENPNGGTWLRMASHPLTVVGSAGEGIGELPHFFFGDGDEADEEWAGVPFTRVNFAFEAEETQVRAETKYSASKEEVVGVPLRLNSLGFNEIYNPARVQHYSRLSKQWFNVSTLQRKQSSKVAKARPPVPDLERDKNASFAEHKARLVAYLEQLSTTNIVRGGVCGLSGNEYIVTRATQILSELSNDESAGGEVRSLVAEGEALAVSHANFVAAVERRKRNATFDRGDPQRGKVWVDAQADWRVEI